MERRGRERSGEERRGTEGRGGGGRLIEGMPFGNLGPLNRMRRVNRDAPDRSRRSARAEHGTRASGSVWRKVLLGRGSARPNSLLTQVSG